MLAALNDCYIFEVGTCRREPAGRPLRPVVARTHWNSRPEAEIDDLGRLAKRRSTTWAGWRSADQFIVDTMSAGPQSIKMTSSRAYR